MQKILISDFDDTFYCTNEDIEENIKKVEEFRKKNNLFIIATARNPINIKRKIEELNIKCDYIISSLGGVIENENELIYSNYLKENLVRNIENISKEYENIELYRIGIEEAPKDTEVLGYKIKTKNNYLALEKIKSKLEKYNKEIFCKIENKEKLFINNKGNSKLKAINYLITNKYINNKNIYTVGDSEDDLDMLKKFNGFRMESSSELVSQQIGKVVYNVAELIKKIDK